MWLAIVHSTQHAARSTHHTPHTIQYDYLFFPLLPSLTIHLATLSTMAASFSGQTARLSAVLYPWGGACTSTWTVDPPAAGFWQSSLLEATATLWEEKKWREVMGMPLSFTLPSIRLRAAATCGEEGVEGKREGREKGRRRRRSKRRRRRSKESYRCTRGCLNKSLLSLSLSLTHTHSDIHRSS